MWKSWLQTALKEFKEEEHPRYPSGSDKGGQFAPKQIALRGGGITGIMARQKQLPGMPRPKIKIDVGQDELRVLEEGTEIEREPIGEDNINETSLVTLEYKKQTVKVVEKTIPEENADMQSAEQEVLAYKLSETIGWSIVPPTISISGLVRQKFVDDAIVASQRFRDRKAFRSAYDDRAIDRVSAQQVAVLDYMLLNWDRHFGNLLIGKKGKLIAIDNGASGADEEGWDAMRKGIDVALKGVRLHPRVVKSLERFVATPIPELKYEQARARDLIESGVYP